MDPYVFKRLWRRPWLSLCSLVLSLVLCLLMSYLSQYRQGQAERLQETKDSFDILCVVTNLQGSISTDLKIEDDVQAFVLDPENGLGSLIRDVRMTKRFEYESADIVFEYMWSAPGLIGVTNERCAQVLDSNAGGVVTYLTDDFYESDDNICIVSQMTYQQLQSETLSLAIKDPVSFLSWRSPDRRENKLEFRIVGYYTGGGGDIYIPYETSQRLSREICGEGGCDAISFLAADNEGLEHLLDTASAMFRSVNPLVGNNKSSALAITIHDEQYRATVAALEQNIQRTTYLLPLMLVVSLGVGFLVSFLSTRGESRTYALMRSLGMTRGRLFGSILREQVLLTVLAAGVTLLVTAQIFPVACYILCHSIGCCIAIIRSIRVSPTTILREQE